LLFVDGLSEECGTCYFLPAVGGMVAVDGECRIDEFEEIDEELCDFVSALWV
jgi:hypothetical protein